MNFKIIQHTRKESQFYGYWKILRRTTYYGNEMWCCLHENGEWSPYAFDVKSSEYKGYYKTREEALTVLSQYYRVVGDKIFSLDNGVKP